jgi:hypothetical protein
MNNFNCHLDIGPVLAKRVNIEKLLQKTVTYLLEQGFEFSDDDKMFLAKNREYYVKQV